MLDGLVASSTMKCSMSTGSLRIRFTGNSGIAHKTIVTSFKDANGQKFVGLANWMVPLQIGAPDMALPRMNNWSFWILPFAFTLLLMPLILQGFGIGGGGPAGGWTMYPPLSTSGHTGTAMDLAILAIHLAARWRPRLAVALTAVSVFENPPAPPRCRPGAPRNPSGPLAPGAGVPDTNSSNACWICCAPGSFSSSTTGTAPMG